MMSLIFEDVLKRSGVNQIKVGYERRDVMITHGFRKFFINQCEKVNLNYTTWKYLAGHKLRKTDASYKRETEEDMLTEYVKAIPLLTINICISIVEFILFQINRNMITIIIISSIVSLGMNF